MGTETRETGRTVSSSQMSPLTSNYLRGVARPATTAAKRSLARLGGSNAYLIPEARRIAAFTPDHNRAFADIRAEADQGNEALQPALSHTAGLIRGDMLRGNPFEQDIVSMLAERAKTGSALSAMASGRYGSADHAGATSRAIMESALPYLSQNYQFERGQQDNAMGLIPMLDQARYTDANMRAGVGDVLRSRDQAIADARYDVITRNADMAFNRDVALGNMALGIGSQLPASTGSTQTTYQPYSTTSNILGGALGIGGLLGGFF